MVCYTWWQWQRIIFHWMSRTRSGRLFRTMDQHQNRNPADPEEQKAVLNLGRDHQVNENVRDIQEGNRPRLPLSPAPLVQPPQGWLEMQPLTQMLQLLLEYRNRRDQELAEERYRGQAAFQGRKTTPRRRTPIREAETSRESRAQSQRGSAADAISAGTCARTAKARRNSCN